MRREKRSFWKHWGVRSLAVLGLAGVMEAQVPPGVEQMAQDIPRSFFFLLGSGTMTSATVHGKPFPIPRFDVGVGINLVIIRTVDPSDPRQELKIPGISPMVQVELGVWDGMAVLPGVLTGLGSVDLIARYLPPIRLFEGQTVRPQGMAWGVKVGVLKDRLIPPVPGVSFTVLMTSWGDLEADFQQGGNYVGVRLGARVVSMHLDVSKNLLLVTPYVGVGYDSGTLELDWRTVPGGPYSTYSASFLSQGYTRLYAGLLFTPFPLVKVVGEVSTFGGRTGFTLGIKAGL